jgi:predicted component of type VI protein secretion system
MRHVTDDMLAGIASDAEETSSWGSSDDSWSSSGSETEEQPAAADSGEETAATDGGVGGDEGTGNDDESAEPASAPVTAAPMKKIDMSGAPSFSVSNRQQASQLLSAVEGFFRMVEPSSPVALLLARARSYFGKDFTSILNELMPPPPPSE